MDELRDGLRGGRREWFRPSSIAAAVDDAVNESTKHSIYAGSFQYGRRSVVLLRMDNRSA